MERHLSFWNMFYHSFSLLLKNNNNDNTQSLLLFKSHPFGKKLIEKMYYNCRLKSIYF